MPTEIADLLPADTPAFQEQARIAEKRGKWPEKWRRMAAKNKLFHLVVPNRYGGYQCSLPDLLSIIEQASRLDGSFGWTLTLGAGAGLFSAFMDPGFARNHFSQPNAFISGSGYPGGRAHKTNHGYKISGTWKYATGSPQATLFTAACKIFGENIDESKTIIGAFYSDEVEIDSSWNSFGLKATASHNFTVRNIIIPPKRTFHLTKDHPFVNKPLYRFPFECFAECTLAASLLGIAEHFQAEAIQILRSKNTASIHINDIIKEVGSALMEVKNGLYQTVENAWQSCKKREVVNKDQQTAIKRMGKNLTETALANAHKLFPCCGMAVLDEQSAINRAWRDLHTAGQHAMLNPAKQMK